MAKISTRMLLPGETPPNPPVPYILLPHEVNIFLFKILHLKNRHEDFISVMYYKDFSFSSLFLLKKTYIFK